MENLLITPDEVLDIAFSVRPDDRPGRIDETRILIAQERFLRPVFRHLYPALEREALNGFVDRYIKPPLAFFVRYLLIDEMAVRLTDQGVFVDAYEEKRTENTSTALGRTESEGTRTEAVSLEESTTESGTVRRTASRDLTREGSGRETRTENVAASENGTEERKNKTTGTLHTATGMDRSSDTTLTRTAAAADNETRTTRQTSQENSTSDKTESTEGTTTSTRGTLSNRDLQDETTATKKDTTAETETADRETSSTGSRTRTRSEDRKDGARSRRDEDRTGQADMRYRRRLPATDYQRNLLRRQAYQNAAVLLRRAIGYANAHPALFAPEKTVRLSVRRTVF